MVEKGAFSQKINYITIFLEIINLKGHQNHITGTRVMAILLIGWIFPIGQSGEGTLKGLFSTGPTPSSLCTF